ncbi:ParB/RepB/Spo0J family partition protein [Streptomyces sp. NPDC088925]|uniref:ParB/RepB/Spo0J family partition protein n=1 Tax=Streptomyces sp. NPDC088925 TaxID=3365914 RepID=UPI0038271957
MGIKITNVKMAHIIRNEQQPREFFDPDALRELADSIKEYGLLQPIVLRRLAVNKHEIVAGERRWRAFQLLDEITIPAVVVNETDDLRAFKASVSENLNREDMLPLEEARAFRRIMKEEEGATEATVAADFGKTVPFVKQRLALLRLTPELAKHVDAGDIGTQAGVKLADLTEANQKAILKKWAKGEFAGDNALVHFAYAMREQQETTISMIVEDMTEEQQAEHAQRQVKARTTLDTVERLCAKLDEIGKHDPAALAVALQGEVGKRLAQLDRVAEAAQRARFVLRQAQAHADAAEIIVDRAAEPVAA